MAKRPRQSIARSANTPIDFKVDYSTGNGYVSQTKVAELCGVTPHAISQRIRKQLNLLGFHQINVSKGISDENMMLLLQHYAYEVIKPSPCAVAALRYLAAKGSTSAFDLNGVDLSAYYPKTTNKKLRKKSDGFVYLLHCEGFYKIGKSTCDVVGRVAACQTGNPFEITLIHFVPVDNCTLREAQLHNVYAKYRTRGEWFTGFEVYDVIRRMNDLSITP